MNDATSKHVFWVVLVPGSAGFRQSDSQAITGRHGNFPDAGRQGLHIYQEAVSTDK
jgi:hypothetical protein